MKRIQIVACILAVITAALWWGIFDYHSRRKNIILNSWNNLQLQVVRSAARTAKAWLEVRIKEQGYDKEKTEQEIFQQFIEPILLLRTGAAWIYNRHYVIYDKNSSIPDIYKRKNMQQIFEIQKKYGAYHYEALCSGVMNGTEGSGWYVWLPQKGREYVAWTPVNVGYDSWTVGLSTPEAEIYDYFGIPVQFRREIIAGVVITALIFAVLFLILEQYRRDQAVMKLMKQKSIELSDMNDELRYQLDKREKAEKDRERLLLELERKYREERDAWKEVSFRAAHKVGNAIFGLKGDVDWLRTLSKRKPLDEHELNSAIEETREGLNEASSIIREFKNYYRPGDFNFEPAQMNQILENAVSHVEKAVGKGVTLIKQFAPDLPDIEIDKTKFKQCITELIENACHFIKHKGQIMICSALSSDEDKKKAGITGEAISVYIKDNGPGVHDDNKTLIFHPFFSTSATGSGMGLAIVQQYVELHRGKIIETGTFGNGAEFLIVLPVCPLNFNVNKGALHIDL